MMPHNQDNPIQLPESSLLNRLQKRGDLTKTNLVLLKKYIKAWSVSEYEALLNSRILSEDAACSAIATEFALPKIENLNTWIKEKGVESFLLDYKTSRLWGVMAFISKNETPDLPARSHVLILSDPTDERSIRQLKQKPNTFISSPSAIHQALGTTFETNQQLGWSA